MAVLRKAIDFQSVDEIPVDVVFLVLTPPGRTSEHLRLLACIARKVRSEAFLTALRAATVPAAAHDLLMKDETAGPAA